MCNLHGGKAPQVMAAAKIRLAALVDPAITRLEKVIKESKHDPSTVSAAKDILDRAGLKPKDVLKIEDNKPTPRQILLAKVCSKEELEDLEKRLTKAAKI